MSPLPTFWSSLTLLAALALSCSGCSESAANPGAPSDGGASDATNDVGDAGGAAFQECFATVSVPGRWMEVQGFATEDGRIRLWRGVYPGDGPVVGETFAYELRRFAVESEDETTCVTDTSRLHYVYGHHNWNEQWDARTDERRYVATEQLTFSDTAQSWAFNLTVQSLAGETLLGPVPLRELGCFSIPPGNPNACMLKKRTDTTSAGAP